MIILGSYQVTGIQVEQAILFYHLHKERKMGAVTLTDN